ncbi:MAG: GAF domain-containing protein, partial [Anaerolineales bacterium]|nr:GAF domain-containing protein [Anaerolineales bacterium]
EQLLGTYGTDEYGQIRREAQYSRHIADEPHILEIYESGVRSRVWQNHPIYDKWMKIDTGWVGAAVLWNGSENIGYLFTDNLLNKSPLRPYEADLLMIYGSILGYLISRKFTEIEINHYVERLNVLQEIDDAILHAESPHKLARAIVQPLKKLVGCDFVRISVFDGGSDTAVSLASTIQNLNALSLIHQFEPQVIGLLEQGIPYVIEKIDADTSSSGERELQELGMQGYIILPLRTEQDLHGMITIAFAQPQHLDSDQFKIVEEVAIQLSIALRQVKLFNQVQDYANNLERLVDERTAQLEAKAQELEAFTYSVSHDLRAPLRAMDGFARILSQMYGEALPEKAQHYVNRIQQNAKRMNALIDGLLTLSRIGRREMQMHIINLTTLAQDVLNNLTADDQLDNAAITIEPLGECMGDPALLRQLLVNLITNAIKYSHKKQSPQVTVRSMIQNGETVYLVKDNGVGFDMRYADKLFGVFQRLHSADEYEGTGVGLATVQRIVQRHNGRIWVEAAVDQGATFYFTLGSVGSDDS